MVIDRKAKKLLDALPEKSRRIIKEKCTIFIDNPFPGSGGDKEQHHLEYKLYRLHVGRSYTIFYQICEKEKLVKILEILPIDKAHKIYDRW